MVRTGVGSGTHGQAGDGGQTHTIRSQAHRTITLKAHQIITLLSQAHRTITLRSQAHRTITIMKRSQAHQNITIRVGGSRGWNYGVDLEEWASKTTFHVGDVLVFEYNNMTNRRHDVYLQTNLWSYRTCNFESRNKIASSEENGSKESFKFTLAMSQPYSFACGEDNGYYCRTYNMKFSVLPGA
ncbi:unnamed protein product [Brassica napus]|uniref:(rape) hypothetical protein n=1 Tax=Brassica napus TaxID=3708 RepID=A0A816PFY9_BRANA|nr:unnamed protein product [Brassica napus]